MLEQQAMNEDDTEQRILLEKQLAKLHEKRREDPASAAEVWVRIAELQPGEIDPIMTAVGLYEKANALDGAAQVLADAVSQLSDVEVKGRVLEKLGEVRTALGDPGAAGDAFSEAGELLDSDGHFERALAAYQSASRFGDAAQVSERRAQLHEGADKAIHLAVAGEMLVSGGDPAGALLHFEAAAELDPKNEELATKVEEQYHLAGRHDDQVQFLLRRAAALDEEAMRVGIRHRAAAIQRSVGDEEGARHSLEMVLEDQEDLSALQLLLDMAERRQDYPDSVQLLERLVKITEGDDRLAYAVREAQVLADGVGDVDGAVERYQTILADFDPKNAYAMHAMADLEMRRSNHQGAAEALEKLLAISEGEQRIETARQLAQLYEGPLDDLDGAIRALEVVYQGDEQDFDAIDRLRRLSEKKEDWPRVATLLARLIEVEGDEEEASEMTRQLASIYRDELEQGDMALKVLEKRADEGDVACQQAYEQLGIELGWKGIVAQKLVQWNESVAGTSRSAALRRSFELFLEVERDADARTVALDLARSKDCDVEMARQLEGIAERLEDLDALAVAHDIIGKSLTGMDRAEEYVRQAEVMARAGADPLDAIQHGELALSGIEPDQAQELLSRLAALTQAPGHVIDLYERQVNRCKRPQDRVAALAAAAQVAAGCGAVDRAREFFNYALSGGVNEDTLIQLEDAARVADQSAGGSGRLLRTLAEALAAGGQGSRDGGRTRSALLRRAAVIAHRELRDMDAAFNWLGDSLIAHVDEAALGALDELGEEVGDPKRVRQALDRALDEVYDGPLVRKLLRRRADLLKTLGEKQDAAADLKRLHDLSPADQGLTKELSSLLTDLGDHRGMIELYEDQILRGREPHVRAELARKVAQIWEEQIGDARETADAWRRVLRMKAGDKDAQAGLERAKTGKLKKPPPVRGKSSPPTASQAAMASSPVVGSGPPVPSYPASGGGLAEAAEVLPEEAASSAPEVPTTGWGDSAPAPPAMVEAEPIEAEPVDTEQTDVGPTQGGPPPAIQDQAQAYDQASYDYATAQDQSPADWGQASPPGYVQGGYDPAASPPGGYDQAAYPQGDGTPGPYDQGQYPQGAYDQAQ
ncbi:MAG: hypothetical protein KC731_01585, partial [Myxococcales bacterium]|nr:hypothetical protein [Myxococcales bacterium]